MEFISQYRVMMTVSVVVDATQHEDQEELECFRDVAKLPSTRVWELAEDRRSDKGRSNSRPPAVLTPCPARQVVRSNIKTQELHPSISSL